MILYPAIDIIDKQCVRLTQGKYEEKTVYNSDPCEMAEYFLSQGATELHIVDLNAAKSGSIENIDIIQRIIESVPLHVQVGGGIRSMEAAARYLSIGASRVIVGTAAVTEPTFLQELCNRFPKQVSLSLDVRDDEILIKGWTAGSNINLFDFVSKTDNLDIATIVVTDVAKDGMMMGPSYDLYRRLMKATKHPIVASGGVGTIEDIRILKEIGVYGAIVGKALYENKITLKELISEA